MIKVLSLSLGLMASAGFAHDAAIAEKYTSAHTFFHNFYEHTELGSGIYVGHGDFYSRMLIFKDSHEMNSLLGPAIVEEKLVYKAIIENLLMLFAYLEPSQEQQNNHSEYIYNYLRGNFNIYSVNIDKLKETSIIISLNESCAIGAPREALVLVAKIRQNWDSPFVYAVNSEACD